MALAYFVLVLCLGKKMPDYYMLIGMVFGLKEGLYWSCANIFKLLEETEFCGVIDSIGGLITVSADEAISFKTLDGIDVISSGLVDCEVLDIDSLSEISKNYIQSHAKLLIK